MKRLSPKANKWEDHYSRLAKKENYPARSVYKLQEIQSRYKLIKKGGRVLDLGCYPGSWTVYASSLVGEKGIIVGVDLKKLETNNLSNVIAYQADILDIDDKTLLAIGKDFDVIISDMAPATTGNKSVDAVRSYDLCVAALEIATKVLLYNGAFLCKIFQGEDFNNFLEMVKAVFKSYKIFKPQSSRKSSKEIYIIGLGKK
ncbi:MAG: RlmE family RNA methyltransferase [Pseudomonadota bacterium]